MAEASLEELLAQSEAQSQGSGSVTNAQPSPDQTAPTVTPGSDQSGVPQPQPDTSNWAVPPGKPGEQGHLALTPMAQAPDSLEGMLSASEQQSQQPVTSNPENHSALLNYGGGMNGRIADAIHGAYWLAKGAVQGPIVDAQAMLKGENPPEISTGGPEYQASREAFRKKVSDTLGIAVGSDPGSTMGHIGENTVDAMLTLGGFYKAAPALAAATGQTVMAYMKRTFGKALLEHPWLAATSDIVGGVPGSTIGQEHFGAPGAILGGAVGNVATALPQMAGRGAVAMSRSMARRAVDAVDTIANHFGMENPPITALGQKPKPVTVPDDVLDAYRNAEQKSRGAGDAVVQTAREVKELQKTGNMDDLFNASARLKALRQDEATASDAAELAFKQIPAQVRGKYSQEATAIRNEFADPVYPKQYAEDQLAGDRQMVGDKITRALGEIQPSENLPSETYSARISQGINDAEQLATKIEKRYWKRVDILNEPMPSRSTVQGDLDLYLNDRQGRFADKDIPYDNIKSIRKLFSAQSQPGVFQKMPTVNRLRAEISSIDTARRQELASDAPNNRLIANLTGLEALGNKWITDAFPDNIPLAQARAFSSSKHDLFGKSELFPFLAQGARGQDRVRPEDALNKLLSRPRAMEDLYNMTDTLLRAKRIPSQPDAYPTVLKGIKEQAPLLQLQADVEDGVRQMFREEVTKSAGDPLKVEAMVNKWNPRIKQFSKVAGEMQDAMTKALQGVKDRRSIEDSALKKYFETNDADKAIDKVWGHPNAPKVAQMLISGEAGIGGFSKDPIALEGFRAGLVDKLLSTGKMDASRIDELLRDGRINRLMSTALGTDRMSRLQALVSKGIEMDKAKDSTFMQNAVWAGRLVAVKFSAMLPRIGEGGQLQQAAIFSEIARRKVLSMMTGGDPVTLLNEAIRNPSMERLMVSKIPSDAKETKRAMLLVRRVLRFDMGLRGTMDALQGRDDVDKQQHSALPMATDSMYAENLPTGQTADPFGNTTQDKQQGRLPPSIYPPPPPSQPTQNPFKKQASVQPTLPSKEDDFREGARVIQEDGRRDRIQGPANRPYNKNNPFKGVPIIPGQHQIPSNRGLFQPWNTVT